MLNNRDTVFDRAFDSEAQARRESQTRRETQRWDGEEVRGEERNLNHRWTQMHTDSDGLIEGWRSARRTRGKTSRQRGT